MHREFSIKKFKRQLEDETGLRSAHPQVAALQDRLMAAQSEIVQLQDSPESPEKARLKHQCAVLTDELVVMQDLQATSHASVYSSNRCI